MSHETPKSIAVHEAMKLLRLSIVVEPMLTAHLGSLHMDTPEDEALLADIRATYEPWASAVRATHAAIKTLEASL